MASSGTVFDKMNQSDAFSEIVADRDRFKTEIYQQLMKRVKKHLFSTERQKSDYVKPRTNETVSHHSQIGNHSQQIELLEQDSANMDQGDKNFDRDAFNKMKEEIKSRKEAK